MRAGITLLFAVSTLGFRGLGFRGVFLPCLNPKPLNPKSSAVWFAVLPHVGFS